jgi:hypothetical protein
MRRRGPRNQAGAVARGRAAMQRPDLTKHLSLPFESRLDVIATSTGKTTVETVVPVCDRSGDIGSHHVWRDGATVGDRCLCGKRKRVARPAGD